MADPTRLVLTVYPEALADIQQALILARAADNPLGRIEAFTQMIVGAINQGATSLEIRTREQPGDSCVEWEEETDG